jgi:hypothetical protein
MQKQIEALTAGLQRVSAQLELNKPAPHTVLNAVRPGSAVAPTESVADFINSPMPSGPQSHLFCAAVVFLAACQSQPVDRATQSNSPGSTGAPPITPASYEVDNLNPFQRDRMGLRGSSYFGRGP